jgi:CubicO group peptidase (beta-lactamase class C family)
MRTPELSVVAWDAQALPALVEQAGYGADDPLVVGVRQAGRPAFYLARGRTASGEPLTAGTLVCTASLSKQVTAACVALLGRQGQLDVESSLAQWMPELPAWAAPIRVRHLIHHSSGLPDVADYYALERAGLDRTTDGTVQALVRLEHPDRPPGAEFHYSNAGYICLGVVLERAAGRSLPDFAREHLFAPLGMPASRYWSGPAPHPPGAAPVDPERPLPLSPADAGLWSTAVDLLRWNETLESDELGVSALLQTPGRLDDGTVLEYGWGLDVLTQAGHRVYRHGGVWTWLSTQLVRIDDLRAGFVILSLEYDEERSNRLADLMIENA